MKTGEFSEKEKIIGLIFVVEIRLRIIVREP